MIRAVAALLAACLVLPACGKKPAGGLSREELLSQLRLEAQSLKTEGEKVDPAFPVRSAWELVASDLTEQPGNALLPYKATVRFKIVTVTKDPDGSVKTDQFEKSFDYVYDATLKKWR